MVLFSYNIRVLYIKLRDRAEAARPSASARLIALKLRQLGHSEGVLQYISSVSTTNLPPL